MVYYRLQERGRSRRSWNSRQSFESDSVSF